jgi:hypothetical protein
VSTRTKQLGPIQRLANWVRSFRRVDGIELPEDGRSSAETAPGLFGAIGSVTPPFDTYYEDLRKLKQFAIRNPDFSQMISNVVALGNTGHDLTVDAATDAAAEAALSRINESAARLGGNRAGVDGLINAYLRQSVVFGAISSEDVIDFTGRRVERVVIVPVEQVRFRYVDGQYVPHQQAPLMGLSGKSRGQGLLGLIPLNPNTYQYLALDTIENSPYAKPPATAAIDFMEGPQQDAWDNIKWIVKKLGILGLVSVIVRPPSRKGGESEGEFTSRAQKYLKNVRDVLDGNFNKGLLVTYNDQKVDHSNVVSDARGAGDLFQTIEELVFSGMDSMAWAHGRNYTTTETFADVVYNILISRMQNHQRLAKRRQERTYWLDLTLAGIPFDSISLNFNRAEDRNAYQKAQAKELEQRMAIERATKGITSPDACAQELGYESAFDPELLSSVPGVAGNAGAGLSRKPWANRAGLSVTFRFDRQSQRYRFATSRIELSSTPVGADDSNVVPFEKKIEKAA